MKVAIDIDGTLKAHPELFSELARALRARGHTVGILTAHHESRERYDRAWLKRIGFPRPAFFLCKTTEELPIPAWRWKPAVMERERIDYLFDDLNSSEIKLLTTRETKQDGFRMEKLWPRWRPARV